MQTKPLTIAGTLAAAAVIGAMGNSLFTTAATHAAATTTATAAAATTADASTAPATSAPPQGTFDPAKGGHVGANGTKEELLTGDTAEKAKAAALATVPGGTIERVETDAEGATYEAHMTKADGSRVTVKMDADFKVTATETGGPGSPR